MRYVMFLTLLAGCCWPPVVGTTASNRVTPYSCQEALSEARIAHAACLQTSAAGVCKIEATRAAYNKIATSDGKRLFLDVMSCLCEGCEAREGTALCVWGDFPNFGWRVLDVWHSPCTEEAAVSTCAPAIDACLADAP